MYCISVANAATKASVVQQIRGQEGKRKEQKRKDKTRQDERREWVPIERHVTDKVRPTTVIEVQTDRRTGRLRAQQIIQFAAADIIK
jgi:hypothetical protein